MESFNDFVPGTRRFRGTPEEKERLRIWVEVLFVSDAVAIDFFQRVIEQFAKSVSHKASPKAKKICSWTRSN